MIRIRHAALGAVMTALCACSSERPVETSSQTASPAPASASQALVAAAAAEEDLLAPVTVALPSGGSYGNQGQLVSLTCSDEASGCAAAYWSLDGSTPANPYVRPIEIFSSADLCFYAVDAAGNAEEPHCQRYDVNTANSAVRDATLLAPACPTIGSACDTGPTLVLGRGPAGPEPGRPNTILSSCADGRSTGFHSRESVDALRVSTLDGGPLASGALVRIETTVWARSTKSDFLDVFVSASAAQPSWELAGTLRPSKTGAQVLALTTTLPAGTLQAVRAQFRANAGTGPCVTGSYNDRDDLVFATEPAAPAPASPAVSLIAPADGASVSGAVALEAEASASIQLARVELYAGGQLVATLLTPPWSATWDTTLLAPGSYSLEALAHDLAGRVGRSSPVEVTVFDPVLPTVALTSPAAGTLVRGSVTLAATASDPHGISAVEFRAGDALVGTATAAPYAVVWDSTAIPDGVLALTARALDGFGTAGTSDPRSLTVDNTPPSVGLTAPLSGARVSAATYVTLSAGAADASGISRVELLVDGALYSTRTAEPFSTSWYSGSSLGTRTLTARATDRAGNVATSTPVLVEVVDAVPPTVWMSSPSSGARLHGSVTVSASPYDSFGIARVEFYAGAVLLGTATASPWSISWDTSGSADGPVVLTARAYDPSGNAATSGAVSVTVDNTPPAVALVAPVDGATVSGSVTMSATASDGLGVSKVEFFVDGVLAGSSYYAPYSTRWYSRGTPLGTHAVEVRATDLAGNVTASPPVSVQLVDVTAPSVSLTSPAYGASLRGTVTLAASASDDYSVTRVEFYRGGLLAGTATSAPWQVSWSTMSSLGGTYTFTAKAYDGSGNVATSSSVSARIDNTPPTVSLTAPADGVTVPAPITVSATASDTNGVQKVEFYAGELLIGTDTTSPYSFSWDPSGLAPGTYVLTARAYDLAGGTTTSSGVTVKVGPDTTPPSVYVNMPNHYRVRGVYSLAAVASDDVGVTMVKYFLDGNVLLGSATTSPYTLAWDTATAADGSHTLTATAYDAAGNEGTSSPQLVVILDNTPPTVTMLAPASGAYVRESVVAIRVDAQDAGGMSRVVFYDGDTSIGSDTTAPFELFYPTSTLPGGPHTLSAKAHDLTGNVASTPPVTITLRKDSLAQWDPRYKVPTCNGLGASCNAFTPGRGSNVGPSPGEAHFSNTLGTCFDGYYGTYRQDESIESLGISTADGFDFAPGKRVRIAALFYSWSLSPTSDFVDVFHAADADAPVWSLVGTITPSGSYSDQSASFDFTLPEGGARQAIRASIRRGGSAVPCPYGDYNDRDDLVFAVGPGGPDVDPPKIFITSPVEQQAVFGDAQVELWAFDNRAVARVDLLVDDQPAGSSAALPFTISLPTAGLADGAHTLTAVATDSSGLQTTSPPVTIVATNGANAVYGAGGFTAPGCAAVMPMCNSGLLLDGRGPLGPEPNAPNTLAGSRCTDATYGMYHGHAQVNALRVSTLDGAPLSAGKLAQVDVTFFPNLGLSGETIDLFLTTTPQAPVWTYLGTIGARDVAKEEVQSLQFVLPAAPVQALRASYRGTTQVTTCDPAISYDAYSTAEADDLTFAVGP